MATTPNSTTERRMARQHRQDLIAAGLTPLEAAASERQSRTVATDIADELFAKVKSGEMTLEQADAMISEMVEERIR